MVCTSIWQHWLIDFPLQQQVFVSMSHKVNEPLILFFFNHAISWLLAAAIYTYLRSKLTQGNEGCTKEVFGMVNG
jgi:hypothetical protein